MSACCSPPALPALLAPRSPLLTPAFSLSLRSGLVRHCPSLAGQGTKNLRNHHTLASGRGGVAATMNAKLCFKWSPAALAGESRLRTELSRSYHLGFAGGASDG